MLRVLAGAILISFAGILVPLSGVASAPAAFYRLAIGGVALAALALLRRERLEVEGRLAAFVLLAGFAFACDLVTWHLSIYRVGPGIATLIANFQVVLMALAGWLFWRERLGPRGLLAIAIAVAGLVLLLVAAPQSGNGRFLAGVGYGLGAALAYTLYLLFLRQAGASASRAAPAFFIALVTLLAAAVVACWLAIRGESFVVPYGMAWLWLALYGLGCQAGGWFLISTGLPRVTAALAGLLLLLQPTLTFAWDRLIFNRRFTWLEVLGAALALLGLYLGMRWRGARKLRAAR
ncbi:MAG TPA: DMT family transporter, partial [Gammaproteobacteria bacterium]|nr:DMT family transporter [Gammaproteobacteria bacterium]